MPGEVVDPAAAPRPLVKPKRRASPIILGSAAAAVFVLAGAVVYVVKQFTTPPPPPPVVAKLKPVNVPAAAQVATKPAAAPLSPVDALKAVANAPANAITKAQDAVIAKRASEQARVDASAVGEEPPDKKAAKTVQTSSPIAPGISATNSNVEALSEATPAFRAFVANAKIPGVFPGDSPRAMINNRLTRVGDIVDSALGITFDGVDADKRQIIFKDKTGATVTRRY